MEISPIQHMVYMYNYAGEPWKAQYWAREIMDKLYTSAPDGYCGDEDNGQTSAWYVFSSLGFYPLCPGSNEYVLGSPLFKSVKITLDNGKEIVIKAENNSKENRYVTDHHDLEWQEVHEKLSDTRRPDEGRED